MTPAGQIALATVLLAAGLWLQLPRGGNRGRVLGAVLAAVAVGLLLARVVQISGRHPVAETVFWLLAVTTIVSAVGAVTMRSPVYCALWFAVTLLGTAALLLFDGAQFLGIATVVVYAGAILVTFLFVLMLAQPQGHTYYDRVGWEPMLSACAGALLIGLLSASVFAPAEGGGVEAASWRAIDVTADARAAEILNPEHMAHLGGQLFSRYLIAVEVAGTLLLAALVGAIAIVAQGTPPAAPAFQPDVAVPRAGVGGGPL
ncbi:MAG TPA: NADH-quinone oxidoreductase subunit J [Pirellulales bacterium]|nr:NADH-quinone oxidoreductase subunit J [Pirellulales bacterium]